VIVRADDSSGIIGDACRRLLELHPRAVAAARVPVGKLVDWMMKFQFDDDEVDFFELDPVAYAPALGEIGVAAYRKRLADVEAKLGPRPSEDDCWSPPHSHEWFTLDWNARLAVLDHDIDAIIRTHAKDRKVAAWLEDTAEAFEEIGEIDLAIDWAKQASDFDRGHQARKAADYWCGLLETHRPAEALGQRLVENELVEAGAQHYRGAARRLAKMRKLAAGSEHAAEVDGLIAELRETHRRRPRLQQEFDRAGLP
jgi:hypothetical protein